MRSLQTVEFLQAFCPCTVDCSVGVLARHCLQEMQIYSLGVGGRKGAAVRNDRYSQGPVTIFFCFLSLVVSDPLVTSWAVSDRCTPCTCQIQPYINEREFKKKM